MDTYFIRHTRDLDIDAATRDMLWNSRKIAIHFPNNKHEKLEDEDNSSLNPDDYPKTDQRAIRAMKALSQTGGYVCAQYYQHTEHLLGYVRPNSKIQLIRGAWGSENGLDGREAILKCLPLEKIKVASPSDIAIILVGRPQQGTISRWPRAGDLIERIVDGRRMEPSLDTLSPQQQEIMCSEFLRSNSTKAFGLPKLAHLLLPVGRTMKDVDICGITETGKILFAQVTRVLVKRDS